MSDIRLSTSDVMGDMTVRVRFRVSSALQWRVRIASALIGLAARIAGCKAEVSVELGSTASKAAASIDRRTLKDL